MEEIVNETKVEKGITLIDLWIVLKKYWIQIVVLSLVASIIVAVFSYIFVKRTYTATAKIIINANNVYDVQNVSYANTNRNYALSLLPTIKDMLLTTNRVSSAVKSVNKENFDDWCDVNNGSAFDYDKSYAQHSYAKISLSQSDQDSTIFTLSFTTTESEDVAIGTVNAIAYSLIKVSETEKPNIDTSTLKNDFEKYVYPFGGMLSPVQLATKSTSAKGWKLYPIIAFVGVFALLYIYFLLLYIFDDSIKSKAEIEEITGYNVIAFIEDMSALDKKKKAKKA